MVVQIAVRATGSIPRPDGPRFVATVQRRLQLMHAKPSVAGVLQLPVQLMAVGLDPVDVDHAALLEEVDLLPDACLSFLVYSHEANHAGIG